MCSSTVTRNQKRNSNYFLKGNSGCFFGCRGGGGLGLWNDVDLRRKEIRVEKVYTVNQSHCWSWAQGHLCRVFVYFLLTSNCFFLTIPRPNPISSKFAKFKHPTNFYTLTGALWLNTFEKSSKNSQKIIHQGNPSNWVIFLIKWNLG